MQLHLQQACAWAMDKDTVYSLSFDATGSTAYMLSSVCTCYRPFLRWILVVPSFLPDPKKLYSAASVGNLPAAAPRWGSD